MNLVMSGLSVFIAYQTESRESAEACKAALVRQGCSSDAIKLWNPAAPWEEPIVEIGKRIMWAHVVLVIIHSFGRRSSWVSAETRFAGRVGVPVVRIPEKKAAGVSVAGLEKLIKEKKYFRLVDISPFFHVDSGPYLIRVHAELQALQYRAADRSSGLLPGMRRYLHATDMKVKVLLTNPNPAFGLRNALLYLYLHPRSLFSNLIVRPIVRVAERRGWLTKIQAAPEDFGKWENQLPTFIGGHAPFFDEFGNLGQKVMWGPRENSQEDECAAEKQRPEPLGSRSDDSSDEPV